MESLGASDAVPGLLERWRAGDMLARDALAERVMPEIRQLAERELGRLGGHVSLQPGDLVNESMIELLKRGKDAEGSAHLRALGAAIVRSVLVDYLRSRNAAKRGKAETVNVSISVIQGQRDEALSHLDLLALDQALRQLAEQSVRAMKIVEMRFFGGLAESEIAEVLGISRPTVARDWAMAKLWLARAISGETHALAPGPGEAGDGVRPDLQTPTSTT